MNDLLETPFFRPGVATGLARLVTPVNHLFDWLYHSRYNPLYRSGTLTVGLLAIVMATGLYLLLFYDVAAPYRSVEQLQSQVWLGRWIRALHRYASDACVAAVLFHVLQLLIQGRTWGPRILAWTSGIVLLLILFFSGWTGYVMVWDAQGQLLALAGANMLQAIPFLRDTLGQAFNGSASVLPSFFFLNLFLHVALPLGMVLGLWVHTAKLARSVWFPIKPIFYASLLALLALSILWPAPLLPEADLFSLPGAVEMDGFYGFWLPISLHLSPVYALLFWSGSCLLGLSVPWWWKLGRGKPPLPSTADSEKCVGCRQCSLDCPYEAISMVPRGDGRLPHSRVDPGLCVSCGICAASCDQLAIGPPQRQGQDQLERVERFCAASLKAADPAAVVVMVCRCNPGAWSGMEEYASGDEKLHLYPVDCVGTLHTRVVERLLEQCGGLFVWACPARNCLTREGVELLRQRLFDRRPPAVGRSIDNKRIALEPYSAQERDTLGDKLKLFQQHLGTAGQREGDLPPPPPKTGRYVRCALATTGLVLTLGALSRLPMGDQPVEGIFRLGARIPGLAIEDCRELSPEEIQKQPVHMRRTRECSKVAPDYVLSVEVDGQQAVRKIARHSGVRDDRPLFVSEDIPVSPGKHEFFVSLKPENEDLQEAPQLQLATAVSIDSSRIYLVVYDPEKKILQLR